MSDLAPISHLMVEIEAAELHEQLPTLKDALYEAPYAATLIEMLVGDVYACAAVRLDADRTILDSAVMGVRLGAWRKAAQDALAITEKP